MQRHWLLSLLIVMFTQHVKENEAICTPLIREADSGDEDIFGFDNNIHSDFARLSLELEREGYFERKISLKNIDPRRTTPETLIDLEEYMFINNVSTEPPITENPVTPRPIIDPSRTTPETIIDIDESIFSNYVSTEPPITENLVTPRPIIDPSRTTPETIIDIDESIFSIAGDDGDDLVFDGNPCNYDRFRHPQPKTNKEGRRVSDIKCEEYSWYYWAYVIEDKRYENECAKNRGKIALQVLGGTSARQGDFPHMGAVGWRLPNDTLRFLCGSSLISPKFALTAAHCRQAIKSVYQDRVEPYLVRFGSVYIASEANEGLVQDVLIAKFWVLEEYLKHPQWKYNDIALIELERNVAIAPNIRPACLWNGNLGNKWEANITGWGITPSGLPSNTLKYAAVDYFDKEVCKRYVKNRNNRNWRAGLIDHQFCAGKIQGGVDTCTCGPLQIRRPMPMGISRDVDYVVGVTSFGIACGYQMLPSVYKRH